MSAVVELCAVFCGRSVSGVEGVFEMRLIALTRSEMVPSRISREDASFAGGGGRAVFTRLDGGLISWRITLRKVFRYAFSDSACAESIANWSLLKYATSSDFAWKWSRSFPS